MTETEAIINSQALTVEAINDGKIQFKNRYHEIPTHDKDKLGAASTRDFPEARFVM